MNYQQVLEFWFLQVKSTEWFKKDELLDLKIVEKFIAVHDQAIAGELFRWRDDPFGRLAEIILIDQFSRNIYRDEAKSFTSDPMALVLAQETIYGNHHKSFGINHKMFLYMPFMHSESKMIHEIAVKLYSEEGLEESLEHELEHKNIIDRYGRYPARNKLLGRQNTSEEELYLSQKTSKVAPPTESRYLH